MVRRERLDLVDIDTGTGNLAVAQGGDQRRLVDDRAARSIHQIGGWLHQGKIFRANQSAAPIA